MKSIFLNGMGPSVGSGSPLYTTINVLHASIVFPRNVVIKSIKFGGRIQEQSSDRFLPAKFYIDVFSQDNYQLPPSGSTYPVVNQDKISLSTDDVNALDDMELILTGNRVLDFTVYGVSQSVSVEDIDSYAFLVVNYDEEELKHSRFRQYGRE